MADVAWLILRLLFCSMLAFSVSRLVSELYTKKLEKRMTRPHHDLITLMRFLLDKEATTLVINGFFFDRTSVRAKNKNFPFLFNDRGNGIKEIQFTLSCKLAESTETLEVVYVYDTDFNPPYVLGLSIRLENKDGYVDISGSSMNKMGWASYRNTSNSTSRNRVEWFMRQVENYLGRVRAMTTAEEERCKKLQKIKEASGITRAETSKLLDSIGIQIQPTREQK